jgi:hypothetical protein
MRTKLVHGRWLLCGHILAHDEIQVGQTWAAADGGNYTVQVLDVDRFGWVRYSWTEGVEERSHEKESFAFQCRYCLVLPSNQIPKELT